MTTTPCYATLYEEWLVKYKQQQSNRSNGSHVHAHELVEEVMTMRAARMVPLMADHMNMHMANKDTRTLLQQIMFDMDRDASVLLPDLKDMSLANIGESSSCSEHHDNDEMNTADAFFNTYPECVRDGGGQSDDDEEEEEQLVEIVASIVVQPVPQRHQEVEVIEKPPPPKQRNPYAAPQQQQQQQHRGDYPQPPHRPSSRGGGGSRNPYQQQPQQQQQQQPRNPYDSSHRAPIDNTSWDDVQNVHNPFQSAAQFQYNGADEEQQNKNNQAKNNHYSREPPPPPPESQPQQQRKIPDSLKRKFQPPKFQPPKKTNDGGKKRGGGQSARPSSRSGGDSKDSDDEELPEALKGLDKELIEKIENEILDSGETVTFDDIAGLDHAKSTVQELVCWPMKRPDLFTGLRRGPNGLLLYGPPGTGKTLIGKAVAHESGATFFSISSSSLTSKWIGEGEKLVRTLFAVAAYREPAVVFIDEIDSLLTQRKSDENEASRRIKTEFLVQLDGTGGTKGRVLVIGATNRPHELDDAARRRFVKRLYIPLPDAADRQVLIRTLLGKNNHELKDVCFEKLSVATDGFSGADLKSLCVDAAMGPLRGLGARALEVDANDVPHIAYKHFRQALRGMNPSVSQADLEVYIEWTNTYGSRRATELGEDDDSDDE